MSEQSTEQQVEASETGEQASADEFKSEESKRAVLADLAKERDLRRSLQARLDAVDASGAEKVQKATQEAQEAAERATTEAFREAAVTFGGISAEDADLLLTGTDRETLQKQALRLMERTQNGPKPDPSQGAKGSDVKGTTADMFAAAIDGAFTR